MDFQVTMPAGLGWPGMATLALLLATSGLISGTCGFGMSAVGSAILWLVPPRLGVPLLMSLSVFNQLLSAGQLRAEMMAPRDWFPGGPGPYVLGGLLGVPFGLALLQFVPAAPLMAAFGVVLVAYALLSLKMPSSWRITSSGGAWGGSAWVGLAGGLVGGFTAFPGALVLIWLALRGVPKGHLRAILQPYILAMQVLALGGLGLTQPQMFDAEFRSLFVVGLVAVLPCTTLGVRLYRHLPNALFRRVVLMLLAVAGMGLVVKGLTA